MKLTMLRKKRDELIETLSSDDNGDGEFDPVPMDELELASKGKSLDLFESKYTYDDADDDDEEPCFVWESLCHERFYNVCREIADLEQSEYKKAMGWNP